MMLEIILHENASLISEEKLAKNLLYEKPLHQKCKGARTRVESICKKIWFFNFSSHVHKSRMCSDNAV